MHREISHTDEVFAQERNYALYLLTGFMGLMIVLEIWPWFVTQIGATSWPTWPTEYDILGVKVSFALAAAVIGGARILYTSLESLMEGRLGADLALAIATIAAILIGEPFVAAEVVFIGLVGECLESVTFERTQKAIRKIVEVCPRRCWLLKDGQEVRIRTTELEVGNVVVVKPGARIPVDGKVLEGRSAVDTSALTGETLPVDKGPGDEVLTGSLNQFGSLTIEARKVGEHTVVGRVIELMSRALKSKANIERTADRMAKYFLPIVLGLAALTFLGAMFYYSSGWFWPADNASLRISVYPTLAVVGVACPCAVILATPAAIIAALGRLAGTGVLIKSGGALERLASVSAFAFDKTGTLTEGKLRLGEVVGLHGMDDNELLRIAASAEQRSEHLIAQLIIQAAKNRDLQLDPVEEFLAHPGAGVTAQTPGGNVVVGNRRLLEEQNIPLSHEVYELLEQFDKKGQTALLVAREGQVLGAIGAHDQVRPEAAGIIQDLRNLGITDIALLTGDRSAVAHSIGNELGITNIHAEILPEQKAEIVGKMHSAAEESASKPKTFFRIDTSLPGRVAMVGDGINDAPALASADVGLAIGSGTEVAAEAGDVVFMGDPLKPLPLLVRLSRETVRIIRQNILIFAFGVNIVGILLTAWLWTWITPTEWHNKAPIAAVLYHQIGSLAVLLNSMRLLVFERTATSPTVSRVRKIFHEVDHWMEHYLDIGEGLHWLSHKWKTVVAVVLVLLLAGYALSGLTPVGPDEMAVVTRFGKPVDDLSPGLHWRYPWPIETVHRIKPDQIRVVEVGFRADPGSLSNQPMSWLSAHAGQGLQRLPEESLMITGDANLIDLQATVRYRIDTNKEDRKYIRKFLFDVKAPDETIRRVTEALLREKVSKAAFSDLLTENRGAFQEMIRKELDKICQQEYELGVIITSFALNDLHPPQEVVQSYYEVTRAMEYKDRIINEAEQEAIREKAQADSKVYKIKKEADTYELQTIELAQAERNGFLTFLAVRNELDLNDHWQVFAEELNDVLKGVPVMAGEEDPYRKRQQEWLAMKRGLFDFLLSLEWQTANLSGRKLLLLDNRFTGQLIFHPPTQFGLPLPPMWMPNNQRELPPREPLEEH